MGTDSGVRPRGRNLDELPVMVECGMTRAQALHSATLSAARLMGLADGLGSIEPGKRAGLVVIDGDPLDLGTFAERVRRVCQDGRMVHDAGGSAT